MYKLVIKKQVKKDLDKIPLNYTRQITALIFSLAENPRPDGYKKLIGTDNIYRVRIGMYRVIYTIEDNILTITVVKAAHRKDVYK
jgi:mRNA interferase RelE/StbE